MAPPRKKKDPKPTLDEEPDITVEESDPDTTVEEADPNLTVSVDDITIEESDHEASIDGNATDTESSMDLEHFDVLEEVNDEMMIWLAKN